ncbi:aconitate hydratase AcnA [Oceanobacillus profundus]|uniref:aconitate hydratase AcnA n=1 Tax=Oceanobacillus profundus TaxID=372463 RepID=UPI0026E29AE8|nr:aconitate hydratase AcnA [Oceanobacillus profundus]MDO6447838.1 aconitate hydratase AcnA [Oceanobacillus profundus]
MNNQQLSNTKDSFTLNGTSYYYYALYKLEKEIGQDFSQLPYTIKVFLEAALRNMDGKKITEDHVYHLANWASDKSSKKEMPFKPYRVLLHDTTGIPVIVDLALLRDAVAELGEDVSKVNPKIPVDLVVDHSVMVDFAGSENARRMNERREFERNRERFQFLKWAQSNFDKFRVFPPSSGIMHQINMEYLTKVAVVEEIGNEIHIFPDSLVGADSHTTMINGLGIVGYGVGGIEAEAAMLGDPLYFISPEVIGFKLTGSLSEGTTATDLALTVTNMLREKNVIGKIVEFYGDGVKSLTVFDRSTISNMAPESGATMSYFPVDYETLDYLRMLGRSEEDIHLIQTYYQKQRLFREEHEAYPAYSDTIELDLSLVVTSLAGPKRPQDRVDLSELKQRFRDSLRKPVTAGGYGLIEDEVAKEAAIEDEVVKAGSVVIAAITSCTNTSNPNVMIGAGLVAKKAIERNLVKPSYVKASLTPGSKVVTEYLEKSGLLAYLEQLGFNIAGYGCATCIGNSGELFDAVDEVVSNNNLTVASVLSGNRNFEGRIHPKVKANYLASPPLVVAYALAGTVDIEFDGEPLGYDTNNSPVYLKDIWPTSKEIEAVRKASLESSMFKKNYDQIFTRNEDWNELEIPSGQIYQWDPESTYIRKPPFLNQAVIQKSNLDRTRILLMLGDSITTDHISPAGRIKTDGPAATYLMEHGVTPRKFNSYPSRRGNYEVMQRGAFANVRIRNQLLPDMEGGYTTYFPTNEVMTVYEAAKRYEQDGTPLTVVAGKEYGTGSSRDWAAKGALLLGVKTVIAESFERIHRSNLLGMGVLPLQFMEGTNKETLQLIGTETFYFGNQLEDLYPGKTIQVKAVRETGELFYFDTTARLDNRVEVDYYNNGGILPSIVQTYSDKLTI